MCSYYDLIDAKRGGAMFAYGGSTRVARICDEDIDDLISRVDDIYIDPNDDDDDEPAAAPATGAAEDDESPYIVGAMDMLTAVIGAADEAAGNYDGGDDVAAADDDVAAADDDVAAADDDVAAADESSRESTDDDAPPEDDESPYITTGAAEDDGESPYITTTGAAEDDGESPTTGVAEDDGESPYITTTGAAEDDNESPYTTTGAAEDDESPYITTTTGATSSEDGHDESRGADESLYMMTTGDVKSAGTDDGIEDVEAEAFALDMMGAGESPLVVDTLGAAESYGDTNVGITPLRPFVESYFAEIRRDDPTAAAAAM